MDPPSNSQPDIELTCPECDYNLTGAPANRCPWCGWEIDGDAMVAAMRGGGRARRAGVAIASGTVAAAAVVVLASLLRRSRGLSVSDAVAVLSVLVAAVGHGALSVLACFAARSWPMRRGTASELLRFAGWVSILGGVLGGASLLQTGPTPRFVRGVQVNSVFEFVLAGFLYALPGFMLLGLRIVSVREAGFGRRRSSTRQAGERGTGSVVPFMVEVSGPFSTTQLTQAWVDRRRRTTPAIEEHIARTWETQKALAEADGRNLYNGDLVRLVGARVQNGSPHFELGPTCYRDFLGTNLYGTDAIRREGVEYLADALGISATIVTLDGFLAYGRRNRSVTFHAGFLHTFGGLVEAKDVRADRSLDVGRAVMRELEEELLLTPADVREIAITGLVRDRSILQPELLFDVSVGSSRDELMRRFDRITEGQEHDRLEFVADEPESIIPFLRRGSPVAPVAAAAMLLHGKITWGESWYEQSCYMLYGDLPPRTISAML